MHRLPTLALAAAFVVAAGGIIVGTRRRPPADAPGATPPSGRSAAPPAPAPSAPGGVAGAPGSDAGNDDDEPSSADPAERFLRLDDGSPVPPLPPGSPSRVRLGVILFPYAGAQFAPADAPSRDEALRQAARALEAASLDFDDAVKLGARGSRADAGWIPRGVLEPSVEHTVFRLKAKELATVPIDTPRGFWIVRRLR